MEKEGVSNKIVYDIWLFGIFSPLWGIPKSVSGFLSIVGEEWILIIPC